MTSPYEMKKYMNIITESFGGEYDDEPRDYEQHDEGETIQDLLDELESLAANTIQNMDERTKADFNDIVMRLRKLDPANADSYDFAENKSRFRK